MIKNKSLNWRIMRASTMLAATFLFISIVTVDGKHLQVSSADKVKNNNSSVADSNSTLDPDSLVYKAMYEPIQALLTSSTLCPNGNDKPATYLANYPNKPIFREGYTLPRLSHWAWGQQVDTAIELTGNWGYALEMGEASDSLITNMLKPSTSQGKMYAKALEDPEKYPLQVNINRWIVPTSAYPKEAFFTDANGSYVNGTKTFSTETPSSFLRLLAEKKADPLRKIDDIAHIAIILHGGESDLSVSGFGASAANQDPKAVAAKGTKSWNEYFSEKKGYQEGLVAEAVRSAVPDRQAYIYYTGSPGYAGGWGFGDSEMRNVPDILSSEMYYNYGTNIGYTVQTNPDTGVITNNNDMLSQVLSSAGRQIEIGRPLSYNWVTGGWWGKLGRLDLYLGFLKSYYMAGNIGAVAGYFDYPRSTPQTDGGFGVEGYDGFDSCMDPNIPFVYENRTQPQPNSIPHWLTQMIQLSQAHGLFSYLEPFLRNGDLVEGPNKSPIVKTRPAYEIPTGFNNTRVVARKLKNSDQWILSAWAADGITRDVTVNVPGLGTVTLNAVPTTHIYYAKINNGNPVLTMVDTNPENPTPSAKALWDSNILPHQ